MKIYQSLLLVFLFAFASFSTQAAMVLQAEGHGEDLQAAKASALTNLSQLVISQVESEFRSEVSVSNDDVNKDISSKKRVTSEVLFKGVLYVGERRDSDGVSITAGLDRKGVADTVGFMQEKLKADYDLLTIEQLEEALLISRQFSALLFSLPDHVLDDKSGMTSWADERRKNLLMRLNQGRLVFVSNAPNYTVQVDAKEVASGDYFRQGNYTFKAKADGYRDLSGRFSVTAGRTIKVKLDFIRAVNGKRIVLEMEGGNDALNEQAVETLAGLGIKVVDENSHRIKITFSDEQSAVDEFVMHKLAVKIIAYKNGDQIKKITARKKLTLSGSDKRKVARTQKALTHKGIKALMSKMDLDNYFAK
jgi:hypothetical protein